MQYCIMGFPLIGSKGLGVCSVNGLNLSPNPPARIIPIIKILRLRLFKFSYKINNFSFFINH